MATQITSTPQNIEGDFDLDIRGTPAGIASSLTLYRSLGSTTTDWKPVETFKRDEGGFFVKNVGNNSFKIEDTNTSGLTAYFQQ